MITDVQLAVLSNVLGVFLFLLVVAYHYINANMGSDFPEDETCEKCKRAAKQPVLLENSSDATTTLDNNNHLQKPPFLRKVMPSAMKHK